MIIDGRDVSVDGTKLDTIETGAEVNNLTDQQAADLTNGGHTNWHHHDNFYYRKTELQTSGSASVHWGNLTNVPTEFNPSSHIHDDRYYTEDELDDGALDHRYFTETEVNDLLDLYYLKTELDGGVLDSRYYTETEINANFYTQTQLNNGQLDTRYYTESEVDSLLSGKANLVHNHDSLYYTKTQLTPTGAIGANVLDTRYFTEGEITTNYYNKTEVDGLIAAASYGISGAVDYYADLPSSPDSGTVYIVRNDDGVNNEGFYRYDGASWVWLAHNVGGIHHNDLLGLNNGDYKHLTITQFNQLTASNEAFIHHHDSIYYTETEIDNLLTNYYTKTELDGGQLDNRYYTETELDSTFNLYYTKTDLDGGQLDNRYYTETEIQTNYYTKTDLDGGQLDGRYYTETELDGFLSGKSNVGHIHDDRYYTETELDSTFNLYFTKTELLNGSLDGRYFTETELLNGSLDGRYYTETEIDSLLSGKSDTGHIHDDRYYTESETDSLLSGKSDTGHIHDDRYYTESELSTDTIAEVHWNNLTNVPIEFNPSSHIHDDRYYTETELDGGQLDNRYYTETELDAMISAAAYGISGSVDYVADLPAAGNDVGDIYIVRAATDPQNEGFYRWEGTQWNFLAANTGATNHNDLNGLDTGDYYHMDTNENAALTQGNDASSYHHHSTLYYTRATLDGFLSGKSDVGHNHNSLYYTETEIDSLLSGKSDTGHIHDDRYYTETEITTNYYTKTDLNGGQLNSLYYTETELDGLLSGKSDTGHIHDDRYYTETEVDSLLSNKSDTGHIHDDRYYTETELDGGQLDGRYYTETEIDGLLSGKSNVGHIHDDRYFTETEITTNYYTKTDLNGGQLNSLYYTESEIDTLLSNKSNINHTHDDRYYTETETDSLLTNYYTKNELDTGQLDGRYFTETEIQTNYYTKTDLNSGQLDNRYYTETEVDALLTGIETFGIKGAVDYYADLPSSASEGDIYIVRNDDGVNDEGFYKYESGSWIWLANNTGSITHNNLLGLNDGDYKHLTNIEYNDLTDGGNTILHKHDDIYYTETEIDGLLSGKSNVGHAHDDLYYTETEVDGLLSSKSDIGHNHNSLYYTETEVDGLLSGKSDTGHIHDDRYYTESEIQTNYYNKTQLNNGQLDSRYYTETEVNGLLSNKSDTGHIHDDRYYTETEIDGLLSNKSDTGHIHDDRYYTESEVDGLLSGKSDTGHIHDDRYYTETELGSNTTNSGASKIGIESITGITSDNVQGALEELQTTAGGASNLQEAYEAGNTVTISDSDGPVKVVGGTTPPLELTSQSSAPNQNLNGGSIAVVDNILYIYDGSRNKWLSPSKFLEFGRHVAKGHILLTASVWDSRSGYPMNKNGTILSATLTSTNSVSGRDVYIKINQSTAHTLVTDSGGDINVKNLNVNFNENDVISMEVGGGAGSPLQDVVCILEVAWRV